MLENLTVPVLNRYDLLDRMIASIDYPIGHLLIVDNGASWVMEDMQIHVPDCVEMTTYLPMPANLGVAASWNLGIKSFPYADRWFFASNDVEFEPGALETLSEARDDEITLSKYFPHWHVFSVGYEAVRRLGGFADEAFFPAYFEDTDLTARANHHGVPITKLDIDTLHENSATIHADPVFAQKNGATFTRNGKHHEDKIARGDFGAGGWDVERRRLNGWEADR
jgi:GT2 family glycosyltransferase